MISQLKTRYQAVCAAAGQSADAAGMTVVFDAGQNSEANFAHLAAAGLGYIGSVPASDCPDLTAYDTRRVTYGAGRRTILTHSPELRESRARGFDGTTLAKAGRKLGEMAATLARGKTRKSREKLQAAIEEITRRPRSSV